MFGKKAISISSFAFLSLSNLSSAALFFLDVVGEIITAQTDFDQTCTPFTARYLLNTDVGGLGLEEFTFDSGDFTQLNLFPGAIESFEFQLLGNPSFFFDNLDRGEVEFMRIPDFGDFLTTNVNSAAGGVSEFDIVLFFDPGFFGDGPFEFDSLLEQATPLTSVNRSDISLIFVGFETSDTGLDFELPGLIGSGVIWEATLSPVPEPSQMGLACVSVLLLAARRKRIARIEAQRLVV